MPHIEESIPSHLADASEAARAWFSSDQGSDFKVTGIVDPERVGDPASGGSELQLILCGHKDGQDVCLRERFRVAPAREGFDVEHVSDAAPEVGSVAPELDPPAGVRAGWLDQIRGQHAFVVLLFYRGFW